MTITTATALGGRLHQEDRFITQATDDGTLLAIMDGHGGSDAVGFVNDNLATIFEMAREHHKNSLGALAATYQQLDTQMQTMSSGTTLSIVWIPKGELMACVAVLGDSVVAIQTPDQELWISPEHNVRTNSLERNAAVEDRGAIYLDGYIVQEVREGACGAEFSRSLGDARLRKILNQQPEIFSATLHPGSVILLLTDGVHRSDDQGSQIERLVWMATTGKTAQDLVDDALNRQTSDNATAIVCLL